jgi:YD repeat-containing protein
MLPINGGYRLEIVGLRYYNKFSPKKERKIGMKKWLCLTLVLVLALALLCGCGNRGESSGEKVYCLVSEREYNTDGVNIRHTEYTYDEYGNVLSEMIDFGFYVEFDPAWGTYVRNDAEVDGTVDCAYEYKYDENHQLIELIDQGETYRYWNKYDEKGRITEKGITGEQNLFVDYEYDQADGMTLLKWGVDRISVSYDKEGRTDSMVFEQDVGFGREPYRMLDYRYLFEYDRDGNLIALKQLCGENGTEGSRYEFEYDDGRLTKKLHYDDAYDERIISTTVYSYDENGNISEAKVITEEQTTTYRYEYKELTLSSEAKAEYFRRNTLRWYMNLVGEDEYVLDTWVDWLF